jgi:hypothetical protein
MHQGLHHPLLLPRCLPFRLLLRSKFVLVATGGDNAHPPVTEAMSMLLASSPHPETDFSKSSYPERQAELPHDDIEHTRGFLLIVEGAEPAALVGGSALLGFCLGVMKPYNPPPLFLKAAIVLGFC